MTDLVQLIIMALTIWQEAGGESYVGKLAVAYVIRNRAKNQGKSISDIVLKAWQFSAWNTDSPTRMNIDAIDDGKLAECIKAALAATWYLEPDPTNGAAYYLNEATVMTTAGKLPDWWNIDADPASEIKIGHHTFRKARSSKVSAQV